MQTCILVVEAEEFLRHCLYGLLVQEGYAVHAVPNCAAALAAFTLHRPDLVLASSMVPNVDGIGLCTELRQRSGVPLILMLTTRDGPAEIVRGLDAGADDIIIKPFTSQEVRAHIQATLRRLTWARERTKALA